MKRYLFLAGVGILAVVLGLLVWYFVIQSSQSEENNTVDSSENLPTNGIANVIPPVNTAVNDEPNDEPVPKPEPAPEPLPDPMPTPTPEDFTEIVRGNTSKKQVIFTFDGGSGTQSAQKILETLKKHDVKGTFFLTGKFIEKNLDLTKQIDSQGHEIFNHTYSHPDLTQISDANIISEFQKTETLVKNLTGKSTKPYFRPPYGARNAHVKDVAKQEGYRSVFWTVDALDWKESEGQTALQSKERILLNAQPGTIYLMHIGDNITGDILDEVFTELKKKGFAIIALSQADFH